MKEKLSNKHQSDLIIELDFKQIFNILLRGKWIIIFLTSFISIIGVIYSLLLPNIYESKTVLISTDSSSSITRSIQGYAGLAGLAGVNLPTTSDTSNTTQAIFKLGSLSFFEKNILPNIFLPNLMAIKYWDKDSNLLVYDENIYDIETRSWVGDYAVLKKGIPTAQKSYRAFKNNHFNISEDKKSGFVSISIKHQSPHIAKKWAELLIKEVNIYYREKDKLESEKAVNYLNKQILMTNLSEVKEVISQLIQEETKKLTLVEANEYYVFDYIDPPALMEEKSEPSRSLISILSTFLGAMLSFLIVFIKHFGFGQNTRKQNL